MFLFWKSYAVTGIIKNENYGTPTIVSGLKTFSSPTYLTGATTRFTIGNRGRTVRPSPDGRKSVETMETYFGLDEILDLSGSGITLTQGKTKLEFDGEEYRLNTLDKMGHPYNSSYMNVGIIKAIFQREKSRGSY